MVAQIVVADVARDLVGLIGRSYSALLRPKFEIHLHRFLMITPEPITEIDDGARPRLKPSLPLEQCKAAEDSRTPGRWRVLSHAVQSARFWSAAVLYRFQPTQ